MSSLTDIIFLLLIFFMLTSSLVSPNALNLKLPGSSKSKITSTSDIDDVRITRGGEFRLNGGKETAASLERKLSSFGTIQARRGKYYDLSSFRNTSGKCSYRDGYCHAVQHQWNPCHGVKMTR